MIPSFLTAIFFAFSAIFGNRSARLIGGSEANFWRLVCATAFLAIWACGFGSGLSGVGFPIFVVSGLVGIGIGDVAYFQTLPRLGSQLTVVVVQCLTSPIGAMTEWLWLGTTLSPLELLFSAVTLVGVGISLAPGKGVHYSKEGTLTGLLFGITAAAGGAVGAVLSRKAYMLLETQHEHIDGGTAAFQRIMGGLLIGAICLLVAKWRFVKSHFTLSGGETMPSGEKWRRVWPWVVSNSLAGQTIGVSCYQWAFATTPTGIVLPVVATTPLLVMPLAWWIDGERPRKRAIWGGIVAVIGVVGLALSKKH